MPSLLCHSDEIDGSGSMGFQIKSEDQTTDIFVIRKDGRFYGYKNSCPHTSVNMEWQEHQFLSMEKTYIQCTTHGALFEIETGRCIAGSCSGDCLTGIRISVTTTGALKVRYPFN